MSNIENIPQDRKCNHRIKSKTTSIKLLPQHKTFTYPEHVFGVCECCAKSFHYIIDENGSLKKYQNNDKEN